MTSSLQWPMYVWAAAVALALVAAAWTARNRPEPRSALPMQHVAGAALVGLFGWEMLINLPASVVAYRTLTAGLGDVRGLEGHQAYVVGQAVFVIGVALAVGGILRRRTWGTVLGIGLAAALALWSAIILIHSAATYGESMTGDAYFSLVTGLIGMQVMPALAAIALLVWPFARRTAPRVDAPRYTGPPASVGVDPRA